MFRVCHSFKFLAFLPLDLFLVDRERREIGKSDMAIIQYLFLFYYQVTILVEKYKIMWNKDNEGD